MELARSIMNHAVGLSRGIKCGDNYNCIEEIIDPKAEISETPEPTPETPKESDQNDSPTDTIDTPVEEKEIIPDHKQSKKKSKINKSYY